MNCSSTRRPLEHLMGDTMPATPDPGSTVRPRPYLTVLLPCYNESAVLPETYRRIKAVAAGLQKSYEIVLVNDGSSDDTLAQMLQFAQRDPGLVIVNLRATMGTNWLSRPACSIAPASGC